MTSSRRRFLAASAGFVSAALLSRHALAQSGKPIRLIVPFPAGGGTDVAARLVADKLRGALPQPVIVENKPGAAGRIAVEYVKSSDPDGSTLLFTPDFLMVVYPHSFKKLSYDPVADFVPVANCALSTLAFSVGPAVPESVKTLSDFIQWCRANPKQAAYASTSAGATPHFVGVMLTRAAGVEITHVPYKGGAPAIQDLIGGQIASSINPVGEVLAYVKSGRLRVLATSGSRRSHFLPEVPTMMEAGYRDVVVETWIGILAPARTPAATVARYNAAIGDALKSGEVAEGYSKFGMDVFAQTPEAFAATIRADLNRWGPVVKASGFTAED